MQLNKLKNMDRRSLLKTLALSTGYAVATPTMLQLLASCEANDNITWKPLFLSDDQAFIIEKISDVMLPRTETPSALDVNTTQFLDLILNDITPKEEQDIFIKGFNIFQSKFRVLFNKSVLKGTEGDFFKIISNYFLVSAEEEERILKIVDSKKIEDTTKDSYFLYKYLYFIKHYTYFAYYTSKEVSREVLKFDPYTGTYRPCIDDSELSFI
jgi:hypothetical protein